MMEGYKVETKDAGVIVFRNGVDTYNSDQDPGFAGSESATYNDTSILTSDDHASQQSIFDRLPVPQSKRQELYDWILNEYAAEQELEDRYEELPGIPAKVRRKKRPRCQTQDMVM